MAVTALTLKRIETGLGQLAAQVQQLASVVNRLATASGMDASDTGDDASYWAGYGQCARDMHNKDVIRLPQRNGSSRPTG